MTPVVLQYSSTNFLRKKDRKTKVTTTKPDKDKKDEFVKQATPVGRMGSIGRSQGGD